MLVLFDNFHCQNLHLIFEYFSKWKTYYIYCSYSQWVWKLSYFHNFKWKWTLVQQQEKNDEKKKKEKKCWICKWSEMTKKIVQICNSLVKQYSLILQSIKHSYCLKIERKKDKKQINLNFFKFSIPKLI